MRGKKSNCFVTRPLKNRIRFRKFVRTRKEATKVLAAYGQMMLQEDKDMDKTIRSLDKYLVKVN